MEKSLFSKSLVALVLMLVVVSGEHSQLKASTGSESARAASQKALLDTDQDGLPDEWEINGHGPLRAGVCNPRKADLIMVVCAMPGVSAADLRPTIAAARAFWATVPGRNPDGTTGINLVTVSGNTLSAADAALPYPEIYPRGFPVGWRGLAHGIVSGPADGGAGQTAQSDWSTVSNDWKVWVHEVGHQLGLEHQPRGFTTFSPVYGSLMNYDYSYSFNGEPNAIQFSRGPFASLRLNETSLTEVLNVPSTDVSFLSQDPYNFAIQSKGPSLTWIDWNRNGISGERRVSADINDGSSVHIGDATNMAMVAGAPSFVNIGPDRQLALLYPEVDAASATGFAGQQLSHVLGMATKGGRAAGPLRGRRRPSRAPGAWKASDRGEHLRGWERRTA